MPDIFISYGRKESKYFATRLHDKLIAQGYDVWFDQNDIPLGVDFQEQIDDGIINADNFVYIIAPHAVSSPYCLKEVELANKYNKRIIPILHIDSDYEKMHPTIQKLNWIYAREQAEYDKDLKDWKSIDDFEKAYTDLISLCEIEKKYVKEHTKLLLQALSWDKEQRKTHFLLVGEERKRAEKWLLTKEFYDNIADNSRAKAPLIQAPCRPSDLHAEFICESRKNAENLLCDAFISHAQTEKELRNQVVRTLAQYNITCWTPQTDVKTGQDWNKTVEEGIEQTDNFIFFITPYTIKNDFFRHCLQHANNFNKRIIPLLVEKTPLADFPEEIRNLTYIDITDNQTNNDLRTDLDTLLQELNTDAMYYYQHKVLLVQALKWKRQNKNASILLRGYNLQTAEDWLSIGKIRPNHKPHLYHEEYIAESIAKRGYLATEVFISYSRNDGDFARKLNNELQLYGKTTWFDQESIVEGVDFSEEIRKGIEISENFLFMISPSSINSIYCTDEVNYAVTLGKRIITVLVEPLPIPSNTDTNVPILHPALAKVQWIELRKDFNIAFGQLLRALEMDREHVQQHNKWGQKAAAWFENNKSSDLLLRGNEYALADEWLRKAQEIDNKGHQKIPQATEFQIEYIQASKHAIAEEKTEKIQTIRRLRFLLAAAAVALVAAVASSIYAFRQRNDAHEKAVIAEINQLAALARQVQSINPALALRIAERAYIKQPFPSVRNVIRDILSDNTFYINLHTEAMVYAVAASPDNKIIATANEHNTIDLWDKQGKHLNSLKLHEKAVTSLEFSADGNYFVSGSADGTLKLWDSEGIIFGNINVGKNSTVTNIDILQNGTKILVCTSDSLGQNRADSIKIYNNIGQKVGAIQGHTNGTWIAKYSKSGRYIISGGFDSLAKVMDNKGKILQTLKGHDGSIYAIDISADEALIATGSSDYFAKIWDTNTGREIATLRGHAGTIQDIAFSPDSKMIATASTDKTIKLWNYKGEVLQTFRIHEGAVAAVKFSADGYYLFSGSLDNTAAIIDLRGNGILTYKEANTFIKEAYFLPTNTNKSPANKDKFIAKAIKKENTVISFNGSTGLTFWDSTGKITKNTPSIQDLESIQFSADKKMLLLSDLHNKILLTDAEGNKIRSFETPSVEYTLSSVIFSPDSKYIVAANYARTIRIWSIDGTLVQTIKLNNDGWANCMAFMPDGETLILGGTDKVIRQITKQGIVLKEWKGHNSQVNCIAVSPDGKQILSGSPDNTVRLWDIASKDVQVFKAHTRPINSVCFSNNGNRILTSSQDGTARLYEKYDTDNTIDNEKRIFLHNNKSLMYESQVYTHEYPVKSACFSPDDKMVLTVANNEAKLWYADWTEFLSADRVANFSLAELAKAGVNIEFEEFLQQNNAKELIDAAEYYTEDYESNEKLKESIKLAFAKKLFQKGLTMLEQNKGEKDDTSSKLLSRARIGMAEIQVRNGEKIALELFLAASNNKEIADYVEFFEDKLRKAQNTKDSSIQKTNLYAMYDLLIKKLDTSEELTFYASKFQQQGDESEIAQEVIQNYEVAIKLYEKLYTIDKSQNIALKLANLCISTAAFNLFDRQFKKAIQQAQRGVALDEKHLDAHAIIATGYLYDNQFEKAKKLYLQYKKAPYNGTELGEIFIGNLQALQANGITCPDFDKALNLLK